MAAKEERTFRIGTRASKLAQWQANWVAERLRAAGRTVEIVLVSTQGDQTQDRSIAAIGSQGVFTKALAAELLAGRIDFAVHSLKDLPTETADGLVLAATPERAETGDVLISADGAAWDELPAGAVVGAGSRRRRAQLLHRRPDLVFRDLRGNVETRLGKLGTEGLAAIILAAAGLRRLGIEDDRATELPADWMLPAAGQGALGIECRAEDEQARDAAVVLEHLPTRAETTAERAVLAGLRAGCLAPVGVRAEANGDRLRLRAAVLSLSGAQRIAAELPGPIDQAAELGRNAAKELIAQGAQPLVDAAREQDA